LVFDELKMKKQKTDVRNVSLNTQGGDASFNLQSDYKSNWKQMIGKI
jgi:hypothetical protein